MLNSPDDDSRRESALQRHLCNNGVERHQMLIGVNVFLLTQGTIQLEVSILKIESFLKSCVHLHETDYLNVALYVYGFIFGFFFMLKPDISIVQFS